MAGSVPAQFSLLVFALSVPFWLLGAVFAHRSTGLPAPVAGASRRAGRTPARGRPFRRPAGIGGTMEETRSRAAVQAGPGAADVTGADVAAVGLTRLDHVGMAVEDLDRAIAHYQSLFGMRCVHREENAEQGVREAMMAVGPDPADGCVQLLAPLSPGSPIARFLAGTGPGVQQVAYTVADLDATSAELRDRGARLLYETPRRGTAGSRINFVHPRDAGGVLVELVEPAAG